MKQEDFGSVVLDSGNLGEKEIISVVEYLSSALRIHVRFPDTKRSGLCGDCIQRL